MVLIKCYACGEQHSHKAARCPYCSSVTKKQKEKTQSITFIIFLSGFSAFLMGYYNFCNNSFQANYRNYSYLGVVNCPTK